MTISGDHRPVSTVAAIVWFFVCALAGYGQWGQGLKGIIWLLISVFTGGLGAIPWAIDYWMSFSAQQHRPLEPMEFFPR